MPKDIDQLSKQLDKHTKELTDDQKALSKEITEIKREIKSIAFKVDTMLEILNNFTIMLAEGDEEDLIENYDIDDPNQSWVPKEEEFWEDDEDDENI